MLRTLTNSNFSVFAELVSAPSDPTDYSPAAMARLMEYLSPYIVDVKGVHFKHHARNKIKLIEFSNQQERDAYAQAWENYLKAIAKLQDSNMPGGKFLLLVQFLKFRQAAELIRAPWIARELWEIVNRRKKSAVCALNFKETISKIVHILVLDYGVSRDEISLIWGGQANKGVKKKRKKKPLEELSIQDKTKLKELFSAEDVAWLKEMGIDTDLDELTSVDESTKVQPSANSILPVSNLELLRLGTQNKVQRQENIDRFQADKSRYCLFTFKAGGVGLSLHQETPENFTRETILAPTYSAIELVQGLGRAHRITSCSDTEQTIVFYAGTIEVRVSLRVSQKLKCLRKVVRQKESWESVIMKEGGDDSSDTSSEPEPVTETEEPADDVLSGGSEVDTEDSDEEEDDIPL